MACGTAKSEIIIFLKLPGGKKREKDSRTGKHRRVDILQCLYLRPKNNLCALFVEKVATNNGFLFTDSQKKKEKNVLRVQKILKFFLVLLFI